MLDINNISVPSITETKYNDVKDAMVAKLRELIPSYEAHESDRYMPIIEAACYRELIMRERINSAVRSMLLPSAEGKDLDLVAARYGIERNLGEKPHAEITLTLSAALANDVLIPAGTVFTDSSQKYFGHIMKDIIIKAGEEAAKGSIQLDEYVIESYAETTIFMNPRPYIKQAKHSKYSGGQPAETDANFRNRILQSLERFSTAGSVESYIYHAMSASTLVHDVNVSTPEPGTGQVLVRIQVPSCRDDADKLEDVRQQVLAALSDDRVRPLTDIVLVEAATPYDVKIVAELELYDTQKADTTINDIKSALDGKHWQMAEPLNISYLYRMLHADNVYRVELKELVTAAGEQLAITDVPVDADKYLTLSYALSCKQAQYE